MEERKGNSFETYLPIYKDEKTGVTLRPKGKEVSFTFSLDKKEGKRYRLFNAGQTALFYWWKSEFGYPTVYYTIHDALDSTHADKAQYCLNLSCKKPQEYIKRVYRKILWKPFVWYIEMKPLPTVWQTGIFATAKNLKVEKDGFLRVRYDIRLNKEGVSRHSVNEEPDKSVVIDFLQGTYPWTEFSREIELPENTASVAITIEGKKYSGEFYVERPYLCADKQNMLSDFSASIPNMPMFDWCSQYLSRKEWPEFEVRLNGKVVFSGEVFERCHCDSDWEIALPTKLLKKKNTLTYRLLSDYHDPLPYTLHEIALLEESAGDISVVSVSSVASVGGKARVLVRTEKPNVNVRFVSRSDALIGQAEYVFAETGLHGIALDCVKPCENAEFSLIYNDNELQGKVGRIALKTADNVITGTGDMIYIHQDEENFEQFLSWYVANDIGEMITVRPTYRWSGTRVLNRKAWSLFTRVVNELDMKYVLMVDGREAPGLDTQPDEEMMQGKGYLGRQAHERDCATWYHGVLAANNPFTEARWDLEINVYKDNPKHSNPTHSPQNHFRKGERMIKYVDRNIPRDYVLAKENSIKAIASQRVEEIRHTGPSIMFKYLKETGFQWFGAETMYTTMETLLAFLRGFAKDCGLTSFGTHNAVQWSSSPHDEEERYRRYRLALYVAYMLGATDINTEEGLWRMEEYYARLNRFSEGCRMHLKQHQDFARYVATHTRSGKFRTPFAALHGRLDGFTWVVPDRTWGFDGKQSEAENSWQVLKVFYPLLDGCCIYRHGCSKTEPQGWYTGTPLGNIDAIPVEGKSETLNGYRSLAFFGYNKCEKEDLEKLLSYAEQGGSVLLTLAHLTTTTDMAKINAYDLDFDECVETFVDGKPKFVTAKRGEFDVFVCENIKTDNAVVLQRTDNGLPLVLSYTFGKGQVLLFNAKAYPFNLAIRGLYEKYLTKLANESFENERVWATTDERVGFSVYEQENGDTHVYFLAVDWYHMLEEKRTAILRIENSEYPIDVPFGTLLKCVVSGERFAYACDENGEVLSVQEDMLTVQGTGVVEFRYCKDGTCQSVRVDFKDESVKNITI